MNDVSPWRRVSVHYSAPFALALILAVVAGLPPTAGGQAGDTGPPSASGSSTIEVLPVGSFHFRRAPDSNDPFAPEQQSEIRAVVDSLRAFRPTKVAIEREVRDSSRIDSLYRAYRTGRHDLRVSEAEQLGFRLAEKQGHRRVYPIDYKLAWPMDSVLTWAKKSDSSFPSYYRSWQEEMGATFDSLRANATIGAFLRYVNSDAFLGRLQAARMRTLEVGAASSYVGVEAPASIARRNMRIFANLLSVADPGDRIVIIYGAGHVHYFREYVRGHPDMELVLPNAHL